MSTVMRNVVDWTYRELTIKQVIDDIVPYTNIHPIYNRRFIAKLFGGAKASKAQGIINSIMMGKDVGEITLASPGEKNYQNEVLDGSNRMSAIRDFLGNKFPIHEMCIDPALAGKRFKDLTPEDQKFFLSYRLRILSYQNMTNETKGEHFRLRNGGTPVNKMEMLNAYGRVEIADLIRSTARLIPEESTTPHELFNCNRGIVSEDDTVTWTYLSFPNIGLRHDEMVARITYLMYRGCVLAACDHKADQLRAMYTDPTLRGERVAAIAKKLNECLDFMLIVAKEVIKQRGANRGLETHEFTLLYRWYIHFTHKNGSFKLVDPALFYNSLRSSLNMFLSKDPDVWLKEKGVDGVYRTKTYGTKDSARPISGPKGAFVASLGQHSSIQRMIKSYEWLTQDAGFDPLRDGSVILVDSRKTFSRRDIEQKLIQQDGKCWITGMTLSLGDAEGAHIKARSLGGSTDISNMVVVHREHNRAMGTMSVNEYRELFTARLKDAA